MEATESFIVNNVFENSPIEEFASSETLTAIPPLSISNYKPLEENLIMCQITPAKFDSF